jgi:hypothetical protein
MVYITYIFVGFLSKNEFYLIKSIQLIIIALTFVKFLFFLRIFHQLGFLIQMLKSVFIDLRWFLLFFGLVIAFFTLFLAVLLKDDLSSYEGIGLVGYYIIALRESIGDYDTNDSFISNSDYKILIWIVYLMIMILGNVIFMNFIIAVVS